MQKLPVGIYSFEFIRRHNYIYVDKTAYLYQMVTEGMFYFLSRPRRFGKSLLVTTLWNFFAGQQKLFEGLWITRHGDWAWEPYPVILLDFNGIPGRTPEELQQGLLLRLQRIGASYDIHYKTTIPEIQLQELILRLAQKSQRPVVILIDEYDKRIIDHLGQGEARLQIARANRDILKQFLGVLKDVQIGSVLRFVLLTGVSKFSKVSLFSELNNLNDLTMHEDYANLLGYTEAELDTYFSDHITHLGQKLGLSLPEMKQELARYYNGYRFSHATARVYNPFSILNALQHKALGNYWFESGTPSFLIHLLQEKSAHLPTLENLALEASAFVAYDLDHLSLEALMFQTGYLTIQDIQDDLYTLSYPNYEVKNSFSRQILYSFAQRQEQKISSHVLRLNKYLDELNLPAFFEAMTAIFATIPYDIQTKRDEAYYHTLFYLMVIASGGQAQNSVLTSQGRIDLVVTLKDKVYIIEFKCRQSAAIALQQIQTKGYADRYRDTGLQIILLGINFDPDTRNIADWQSQSV